MYQEHKNSDWYQKQLKEHIQKYGAVPPPWIYLPDEHPFSMAWRMGIGESHIMVFSIWWEDEGKTFEEKIKYFKKFPPTSEWVSWMIDVIWDIESWNYTLDDFNPYLKKLKQLGFDGIDQFEIPN